MSPAPSPTPLVQPPAPGLPLPELVIGGLLALVGLWSLGKWMRTDFVADSWKERVLYSVHVTTRVGLWFGFAGFFFGLALVDEPGRFTWFVLVPLALAGVQLVTAVALRQAPSPDRSADGPGMIVDGRGKGRGMETPSPQPGPFEPEKRGETADPGHAQPEAAEVESARLLANQARPVLRADGFTDDEIRTLADEYIALDRGEGLGEFVQWAKARKGSVR